MIALNPPVLNRFHRQIKMIRIVRQLDEAILYIERFSVIVNRPHINGSAPMRSEVSKATWKANSNKVSQVCGREMIGPQRVGQGG